MIAVAHKGHAIHMLNAQPQSGSSSGDNAATTTTTSDNAITAASQLMMDEWYWGQTRNLHAHLRGLREMIRLRGGLKNLGMSGLVSKLAVAYVPPFPFCTTSFLILICNLADPNLPGSCISPPFRALTWPLPSRLK